MTTNNPRTEKLLQKYAYLIGGEDAEGTFHKIDGARKMQHVFWVKNRDEDETSGEFMLGHVVRSKIQDGYYDVEYVGMNKHTRPAREGEELSTEHKATLQKFNKYQDRQLKEVANGIVLQRERIGKFVDVESVLAELQSKE